MADQAALPGVDQAIPNVAGMWDYYLGGNENTDADREAARLVLGAAPDVPLAALENREFLKHAVRFLAAESGICQFIDIGPASPPGAMSTSSRGSTTRTRESPTLTTTRSCSRVAALTWTAWPT